MKEALLTGNLDHIGKYSIMDFNRKNMAANISNNSMEEIYAAAKNQAPQEVK